jgi:hypothetical protein
MTSGNRSRLYHRLQTYLENGAGVMAAIAPSARDHVAAVQYSTCISANAFSG